MPPCTGARSVDTIIISYFISKECPGPNGQLKSGMVGGELGEVVAAGSSK